MTSDVLARHGHLSADLADLLEERALVSAAVVAGRARTFVEQQSAGMNITTIREMATANVSSLECDLINLTGKVDAARVRLHHLDQQLAYGGTS